jgi:nucleotide-binding universal stress UspA family protein
VIVVGTDGSAGSDRAVAWALDEARRRGVRVELVHVWSFAIGGHAAEASALAQLEAASQALLDRAVAAARAVAGETVIRGRLVVGHPAHRLVERSVEAELLVVGSRGHGPVSSLLLGSVADACVRHAACPVVVVPPDRDRGKINEHDDAGVGATI